jgi:GT2 family glycosyltransferase
LIYPFVSVIVLNYNGEKYLKNLFVSLLATDYPFDKLEIMMGDNASTDSSVSLVQKSFPSVKILRFDKNYGFCKGNNLCVEHAKGQFIVFLNTDTTVTNAWLKTLVTEVINNKNVVTAGSKLIKPNEINGRKVIDYAGGKITFELNYYEGLYEFDGKKYSTEKFTGFGCGAAVIVDKKFFEGIGGFDEYYFGGGEEVELGLRAWQYGFKVLYVPSSIVYHFRYSTFKTVNDYATYEWVKSTYYFILKNYEKKNIIYYTIENLVFSALPKCLVFIFQGNLTALKSVLRGSFDFVNELKSKGVLQRIYAKRLEIRKRKKLADSDLAKLGFTSSFAERGRYRIKTYQGWKSDKI